MDKKSKFKLNGKVIVLCILMIGVFVGFYLYLGGDKSDTKTKNNEYKVLSEKDLELEYPKSPDEVLTVYSRIVKCLYKGELEQKEEDILIHQMRSLYSEKLLKNNPFEEQKKKLDEELADYEKNKISVINYKVDKDSLKQDKADGVERATMVVHFSLKEKSEYTRTNERFLMEKEDGKWKIVGWELTKK